MDKKLYIIGNGFDLWHGLPTAYKCYNCYMMRQNASVHERIGKIYNRTNTNELWSDYEKMLPRFDIVKLVENNIEKWCKCSIFDFENAFDELDNDLKGYLHEWVLQIDYSIANGKMMAIDTDASFLNFNYTNTLERLYNIHGSQVCYIHGDTGNNYLYQPVIGHGMGSVESFVYSKSDGINHCIIKHGKTPNWADDANQIPPRRRLGQHVKTLNWADDANSFKQIIIEEIIKFIDGLKKDTELYIRENEDWFNNQSNIKDIYVLGHSLSEVDAPYFKRIYNNSKQATWHVSYYGEKERKDRKEKLCKLIGKQHGKMNVDLFELDELQRSRK